MNSFLLIILIIVVVNIYGIININKYNKNSTVQTLNSNNNIDIKDSLLELNPLILKNVSTNYTDLNKLSLKYLSDNNKGYIVNDNNKNISFDIFNNSNKVSLYHNAKCINDFNIDTSLNKIIEIFNTNLSCNINHYLNIFKGRQETSILTQKNDTCIYTLVEGECIFYLINPKYHENIKDNKHIKKWSNKIIIQSGNILYIPPNWKYYYTSNDTTLLTLSTSDKYYTYIYNLFK
tara:strand:- start:1158 stop:1859 length:702 start_codon:yes stop_codon:yes gene_type:complete